MKILKELITDVNIWVVIVCIGTAVLTIFDVMKVLETKTLQIIILCLLALSWTNSSVIKHHLSKKSDTDIEN